MTVDSTTVDKGVESQVLLPLWVGVHIWCGHFGKRLGIIVKAEDGHSLWPSNRTHISNLRKCCLVKNRKVYNSTVCTQKKRKKWDSGKNPSDCQWKMGKYFVSYSLTGILFSGNWGRWAQLNLTGMMSSKKKKKGFRRIKLCTFIITFKIMQN